MRRGLLKALLFVVYFLTSATAAGECLSLLDRLIGK
jgi:hypothetical protein